MELLNTTLFSCMQLQSGGRGLEPTGLKWLRSPSLSSLCPSALQNLTQELNQHIFHPRKQHRVQQAGGSFQLRHRRRYFFAEDTWEEWVRFSVTIAAFLLHPDQLTSPWPSKMGQPPDMSPPYFKNTFKWVCILCWILKNFISSLQCCHRLWLFPLIY